MSAQLGPIHHRMYQKIRFQEALIDQLIALAEANGWQTADGTPVTAYAGEPEAPLETIIDFANIHGWLSGRIADPERRYAALVTGLLAAIEAAAFAFGQRAAVAGESAPAVYQAVDARLLDGMPCDRAIAITENEADRVTWQVAADTHSPYWTEVGGDGKIYYKLRTALIAGMLSGSGWRLAEDGGTSAIVAAR
ncbi:hypothetical protein [Pseudoramibacter alactolyticus]